MRIQTNYSRLCLSLLVLLSGCKPDSEKQGVVDGSSAVAVKWDVFEREFRDKIKNTEAELGRLKTTQARLDSEVLRLASELKSSKDELIGLRAVHSKAEQTKASADAPPKISTAEPKLPGANSPGQTLEILDGSGRTYQVTQAVFYEEWESRFIGGGGGHREWNDDVPVRIGAGEAKIPWNTVQAIYCFHPLNGKHSTNIVMCDGQVMDYSLTKPHLKGITGAVGKVEFPTYKLVRIVNLSPKKSPAAIEAMRLLDLQIDDIRKMLKFGGVAKWASGKTRAFKAFNWIHLDGGEKSDDKLDGLSLSEATITATPKGGLLTYTGGDGKTERRAFTHIRLNVTWDALKSDTIDSPEAIGMKFSRP